MAENDAQIKGEVITLASRVDGWLVARPVMDGDKIVKGQILARIDDRDARLRLADVEGSLAAAWAQASYIEAQRDTADNTTKVQIEQAQLGVAQNALASAGHQLELAQTNFQRDDSLVKDGGMAQAGKMPFDFCSFWFKDQQIRTGQANVKAYNRQLARLIHQGKANPAAIISHRLKLEEAPAAYTHFDDRNTGWTKVTLKP